MSKLITEAPNNERKTLWETTRQGETLCQSMRLVYRKKKKSWRSPVAGWMDGVGDLYLKLRLIVIHGFLCVDLLSCDILLLDCQNLWNLQTGCDSFPSFSWFS